MTSYLRYDKALDLAHEVDRLFRKLASFTDAEEDRIMDGAEADHEYIDALSDACLRLDEACTALGRIE